ncbi:MAG: hypothetical protein WC415_04545 [Patescibacteria group bacterium]|jgi:hypothetical protein
MFHFFLGASLMVIGALITIKAEAILSFFGPISFFEKYLGSEGGSRLGWKLIGILFFFIGFLIMTGMINGFMLWILSPLLGAGRSIQ